MSKGGNENYLSDVVERRVVKYHLRGYPVRSRVLSENESTIARSYLDKKTMSPAQGGLNLFSSIDRVKR